ncbi:acylphosphatase [Viridibacillus sp. YIM B01967]|uniref:Acylphosphatase n=1 Tax=Viridibacillus soli TaxID=2798301 RepID=A0ABS1H3B8_9BACL|nr:acylphosphatase [Viridibacillus soli]MBK3493890.1 acylphosphatase [Viridibacillus soli]
MNKRAHIIFNGNVQNHGYRFFIKQKAIEIGLKGTCFLNELEQIEVDIEGTIEQIDQFLQFVQRGVNPQTEKNSFRVELHNDLKGYTSMESDIV